jgi:glycosyltransferase involved in cell wall biosynthesis
MGDGAEGIHIAEMVAAFREAGHTVHMVGPSVGREGISGEQTRSGFSWIKKIFRGPLYELVEICYNILGFFLLRKAIKACEPDLIYDRYITFNYSCVAAGRRYGVPVFVEINAPLALERDKEADEKLYLKRCAYWLEKKICTDADHVFAVSTPLKKYLVTIGVPPTNITVLPNGVNTSKFYPRPKSLELLHGLGLEESDVVVGFVGILRPWHGIELLLTAMEKVCLENEKCKLILVGDGPIHEKILFQADILGIAEKVVITGRVPHDKVPDYISLFDIAVSPKATFYASPMKIVEYMAMGKAVIVPDTENIRDLVEFGKDGLCFTSLNSEKLSEQLKVAVEDPLLRHEITKNAILKVDQTLKWQNNVNNVKDKFYALSDR